MSNKQLKLEVLSELRNKAVYAVVREGMKQNKAAKVFGFSETSISKYVRDYKAIGESSLQYKTRGASKYTGSYLSECQIKELKDLLLNSTPDMHGIDYTLWNSKSIREFIMLKFNVSYASRSVRDLLQRMGFSSQKPIKRAYQRNETKIQEWLNVTYPAIKQRAMKESARIYWADEMGVQSTDNRGKSYGLVGHTPVIKKSGSKFKVNLLAAISPQGFMNWMVFEDNCDSDKFIEFLGRMRRQVRQKIFLIVDNHKIHHSKKVTQYVEKFKSQIEIFFTCIFSRDEPSRVG